MVKSMSQKIYGWSGKILRVDLSKSKVTVQDTREYAERFLVGRGIATRIYWEEVGPEVGALDPENCLIFMSGTLVATGAQGATRMTVISKSPC
jgi:aldehyde:ferredoxin oxidoreductase